MPDYYQLNSEEREQRIAEIVSHFPEEEAEARQYILTELVNNYQGYDKTVLDLFSSAVKKRIGAFVYMNLQRFYDKTLHYCHLEYRGKDIPVDHAAKKLFLKLSYVIDQHAPLSLEEVIEEQDDKEGLDKTINSTEPEQVTEHSLKKSA